MSNYTNILVALDLSNEANGVLARAVNLADKFNAKVTIVHVVEPVVLDVNVEFSPSFDFDLEEGLVSRATAFLQQMTAQFSEQKINSVVLVGSVKHEIHSQAKKDSIDLIVIGTHGRHGVARLLGSTASSVLHGAPCDVLTVKIA